MLIIAPLVDSTPRMRTTGAGRIIRLEVSPAATPPVVGTGVGAGVATNGAGVATGVGSGVATGVGTGVATGVGVGVAATDTGPRAALTASRHSEIGLQSAFPGYLIQRAVAIHAPLSRSVKR